MQRSIKGEVAWVTGGGTGIGQAGALRLAAAGAKIVLTGRRREPLEETAKMIRDKGGEAIVAPADMSKRDEVEAVAKRIADEHGRCDILVNSAGINVRNRKWADVDPSAFDSVMDANLSGPFYATAAVLPMMRCAGVFIRNDCTAILSRPSGSAKCGCSQPTFSTSSRLACGRMKRVPPAISSSMMGVISIAPIFHID